MSASSSDDALAGRGLACAAAHVRGDVGRAAVARDERGRLRWPGADGCDRSSGGATRCGAAGVAPQFGDTEQRHGARDRVLPGQRVDDALHLAEARFAEHRRARGNEHDDRGAQRPPEALLEVRGRERALRVRVDEVVGVAGRQQARHRRPDDDRDDEEHGGGDHEPPWVLGDALGEPAQHCRRASLREAQADRAIMAPRCDPLCRHDP